MIGICIELILKAAQSSVCSLVGLSNKYISEFTIALWEVFFNSNVGEDTSGLPEYWYMRRSALAVVVLTWNTPAFTMAKFEARS